LLRCRARDGLEASRRAFAAQHVELRAGELPRTHGTLSLHIDRRSADVNALIARWLACALFVTLVPGCAHEIYGDPGIPIAGKVLGTVVHTQDAEELRYVVLRQLTDRYADEKGIAVTQAEEEAYVRHVREALDEDRRRQVSRRDELTRELAGGGLSEEERNKLTSELDAVNRFLAALGEAGPGAAEDPEETRARQQVAESFIRQWKINRALYQQYGGRIIFQQGGPEPLDAYRVFLEERQARGDFEILNKDLEAAFWRYYRTDSIHSFYRPGSKEEAEAFAVPFWQSR